MYRNKFILPSQQVYMCGHSLGPMPVVAKQQALKGLHDWSEYAVQAWNDCAWFDLPSKIAHSIATLMGALPHEVVLNNSTSVNLFQALMSALKLNANRHVILTEESNFPADLYIAEGIAEFYPKVRVKKVDASELLEHMNDQVAVLMLTPIDYRTAKRVDMTPILQLAREQGILTVLDLSHSLGAVSLNFDFDQIDFAVGCTYKYLSGGPGAPAFLYVNNRHHSHIKSAIQSWMGHEQPFAFEKQFRPAQGSKRFMVGTPAILSMLTLDAALQMMNTLDLKQVYHQSQVNATVLIQSLHDLGLNCLTVQDPTQRGCHVAFSHPQGYALSRALIDHGIVCDFRANEKEASGIIRFCVNALYLSEGDILNCIAQLQIILDHHLFLSPNYQLKHKVT